MPRYALDPAAPTLPGIAVAPILPTSQANRGRAWEDQIEAQHALYRLRGWRMQRQYVRVLIQEGGRAAKVIGTAPPDWWFGKDGRWGEVDLKDWRGAGRWHLNQVAPHLAASFDLTLGAGGIAGIVLRYQGAGWWLPWGEVGPRWRAWSGTFGRAAAGSASLGPQELMEVGERFEGADWLPVAIR